jgi:hypothetical protein
MYKDNYSVDEIIEKIVLINSERRRTLEFCDFMKNDKELEAVNNGLNSLNMNDILDTNYYIHDTLNIHIISTPNRRTLTRYLCEEALKKDFNPVVLGIYGNEGEKYHLLYDNQEIEVSHIMDRGEFNVKLNKLFTKLKNDNVNIERPFIIIGNYNPTGESLTFVNSLYGTVRGNIRLISTNAEEDYQEASRSNFMTTKFLEQDPTWVMPEKYLIGPEAFIKNALSYEAENDARIDTMILNNVNNNKIILSSSYSNDNEQLIQTDGTVGIPIKIAIDTDNKFVKQMIEMLENNTHRTEEQRNKFLSLIKQYVETDECEFEDKTSKFDFDNFRVVTLRGYSKKNEDENPKKGNWKFKSYQNHFDIKTPFINNTNSIKKNECEILTCLDTYILKDNNGKVLEKNLKTVWWIGYKY